MLGKQWNTNYNQQTNSALGAPSRDSRQARNGNRMVSSFGRAPWGIAMRLRGASPAPFLSTRHAVSSSTGHLRHLPGHKPKLVLLPDGCWNRRVVRQRPVMS
jgi:hypothetical protein